MPDLTPSQSSAVSNAKAKAEVEISKAQPAIDTSAIKGQARLRSFFQEHMDSDDGETMSDAISLVRLIKNESGNLVKETLKITSAGTARVSSAEYPQLKSLATQLGSNDSISEAYEATLGVASKSTYRQNLKFSSAEELFRDVDQVLEAMGSQEYKNMMQKMYQNEMRIPDPSELRVN